MKKKVHPVTLKLLLREQSEEEEAVCRAAAEAFIESLVRHHMEKILKKQRIAVSVVSKAASENLDGKC